jgi:hypothetical protein
MPILTVQLGPYGPLIDLLVGVSKPRADALRSAGVAVPTPQAARCLIDTGASATTLDRQVIQALGIMPTGTTSMLTPSTAGVAHPCNTYDVAVILPLQPASRYHIFGVTLPVIESDFTGCGIQGLIGRDLLSQCVLGYNGVEGQIFLAV